MMYWQSFQGIGEHAGLMRRLFLAVILISWQCAAFYSLAWSESPQLTRLFPAGGQRGQTVPVEAKGKFPNQPLQVWVDQPGIKFEVGPEAGKWQAKIDEKAAPGLYLVRAHDSLGATDLQRFIVGVLPEANEMEPNDESSKAQTVTELPRLINGVLEKRGDVDHFRVTLKSGQTLVASVEANRLLGSPVDACLQVCDLRGNLMQQNLDYHGLDPLVTYTAKQDEEVIVRAFGFPATADSSIHFAGGENFVYRLTLTTGAYLEATLPLAVTPGDSQSLRPFGWNLPHDVSELSWSKTDRLPSVEGDAFKGTASLCFFAADGHAGGVFLLPSDIVPWVDHPIGKTVTEDMPLPLPASLSGQLPTVGERTYWVDAKKDQVLEIRVVSRVLGYPLDAVLTISDAAGKQLVRADDTDKLVDPKLAWKCPVDGRYQINLSDLNRTGSEQNFFHLFIQLQRSDYRAVVKGNTYRGKVNMSIEIPVAIERIAGFDGEVEFEVGGLPAPISIERPKSEAKGESAKQVTLKLSSKEPFNGSLQINSRHGDRIKPVRDEIFETGQLWLEIQP
jgi:hypothetical protein